MVTIPVSVGEIIDKLSILQVKKNKISDKTKLEFVNKEFEILQNLSSVYLNNIEIESLYEGVDFNEVLTRAKFEELNADLFKNTMGPVNQALEDSGFKKNQIDEIVLVGGSTRIPKIR